MDRYLYFVIFLNFSVVFLLLLGTNRLSGFPPCLGRMALAAGAGGLYAGVCLVKRFQWLGAMPWPLVVLAGISGIAFGWDRYLLKRGGLFTLLCLALGGVLAGLDRRSFLGLTLAAGGIYLLCRLSIGVSPGSQVCVPLVIQYRGKKLSMMALRDSGNTLRDPVTGEQVLLISGKAAQQLTGLTMEQLRAPLETMLRRPVPGLRLIPFRSVGCSGGMLLGLRFENVLLDGSPVQAVTAFVPDGLGEGQGYQALAAC